MYVGWKKHSCGTLNLSSKALAGLKLPDLIISQQTSGIATECGETIIQS